MLTKLYHPAIFQGSLHKRNYFEGWYLKHVSSDHTNVVSLIPGVALNDRDPHCFIQYINGITGETHYFQFPLDAFKWDAGRFDIEIAGNKFSENGVSVKLVNERISINGHVTYSSLIPYPGSLFSPGIMGWYSFVPLMECKHGVVSLNHRISGGLTINGDYINLEAGNGYIEKDWGTSFPEAWIWLQCNNFGKENTCLMFSVAKIPWLGKFFIGFICFLYVDGKLILFSTYNKSKLVKAEISDNQLFISLKNKEYHLEITASSQNSGILKAPKSGNMDRHIKESIDAKVDIRLKDPGGRILLSDQGQRAGLEVIEGIFRYLSC